MQEASSGKEVAFRISPYESFLLLHMTSMSGEDGGVIFQRMRDQLSGVSGSRR